ncbi:hypothetical protein ACIBJF_11930 [Streptomyces sp. NPDC050743]|uniref:hypothetical protein n=1 Tax=Streptomyces sp. NPDC050743 TaxID=3365634 RepID=UPI0037B80F0C
MTSAPRHRRYGRALGAGTLSVALLSGGTAGAFAVTSAKPPTPSPTRSGMPVRPPVIGSGTPSMKPSRVPMAMGSITISPNRRAIKAGDTVVFTGRVTGAKRGSTLVLQHMRNGKWTTLRTTTVVGNSGRYTIKRTFTSKGTEQVRVAVKSGMVHSSPVSVKVS